MADDKPKYSLEDLLAQCDATFELTEEDRLWLGTPGDEEAKITHLENLLEDAEDLEAAHKALAEGGPWKTAAKVRADLGLESCYKGYAKEVRQERDRWDDEDMLHTFFDDGVDLHSKENRQRLAQMIMRLFKHWGLESRDQAILLGLSPGTRTTLSRYRNGSPLADQSDLLARVGHILGIHKSLGQIFPQNIELAYQWISQPNRRFGNRSPLQIMRQGYEGLLAVRRYLDFERYQ